MTETTAVHHEEWYDGVVIDYDAYEKKHDILYDGEEESCKFDLILDLLTGDLQISLV